LSYCGEIEKLAAPRNGKPPRKLARLRRRCSAASRWRRECQSTRI